ncbi:MAG: hypothetical protein LAO23_19570 [Acidobacteriia bacterium]|nr:hypothetical protein [Terriglobia bacterium]
MSDPNITAITPREFAIALRAMLALRDESWNDKLRQYELRWREAAETTVPVEWQGIAVVCGIAGFCDVWEWCDRVLGPEGEDTDTLDPASKGE